MALHTFVVCDLLPPQLKIHGLLHDAAECIIGDIPKPAKTLDSSVLENEISMAIYRQFQINPDFDREAVHHADVRALHGEVHSVGTVSLRDVYPVDLEAQKLVEYYQRRYLPMDCIDAYGMCPNAFIRRFYEYRGH